MLIPCTVQLRLEEQSEKVADIHSPNNKKMCLLRLCPRVDRTRAKRVILRSHLAREPDVTKWARRCGWTVKRTCLYSSSPHPSHTRPTPPPSPRQGNKKPIICCY
ncbi:unnamed protein product [Protopolystoma xenopodis]|uniref:Uncharacterized protein n=1 Tax=Protopolystoma xenopodis TaxID=117903 RepID=A0A3S5CVI5_9PLAT|nr:unnamed protein product [Protopolystoma xenopodis]